MSPVSDIQNDGALPLPAKQTVAAVSPKPSSLSPAAVPFTAFEAAISRAEALDNELREVRNNWAEDRAASSAHYGNFLRALLSKGVDVPKEFFDLR